MQHGKVTGICRMYAPVRRRNRGTAAHRKKSCGSAGIRGKQLFWGSTRTRANAVAMAQVEDVWVDRYLEHLHVERALGERTRTAYASDLRRVLAKLEARGQNLHSADTAAISAVLIELAREGTSARSQARLLSSLRGLYRFLEQERLVTRNPLDLLRSPRFTRKLPSL